MEFSRELHDDIAAGDITLTYRLWRRRHARVGGRYRVGRVEIEADDMGLVPFSEISDATCAGPASPTGRRCGHRAAHAGPITADTMLYRIAFHVVG